MEALELLSSRASARLGTKIARLDSDDSAVDSLTRDGGVLEKIWQMLQIKENEEDGQVGEEKLLSETLSVLNEVTGPVATLEKVKLHFSLLVLFFEVMY